MPVESKGRVKAARFAAQTKTVMQQWSAVLAESFGLAPPTPLAPAPVLSFDPDRWGTALLGACWLGHATTLLRIGGANVLVDPHFDERAGVAVGKRKIGRRRAVGVPLTPEALPPIDVLLLTHAHMDHWDTRSLSDLARMSWAKDVTVVVPRGTKRLLPGSSRRDAMRRAGSRRGGFGKVIEVGWGEAMESAGLSMGVLKPRHWGARYFFDRHRGYNSYVLEALGQRVLVAGDTAHTHAFDGLASSGVDLAVMGIGSYEPWHDQHATPEEVAAMAGRMNARLLMPIHHATFHDSNVPLDEPLERLLKVWDPARMVCPRIGEFWVGG